MGAGVAEGAGVLVHPGDGDPVPPRDGDPDQRSAEENQSKFCLIPIFATTFITKKLSSFV